MERTVKLNLRMRIIGWVCLLAFGLGTIFTPSPSQSMGAVVAEESHCQGEINVCLKSGKDISRVNGRYGTYVKESIAGSDDYLLGLPYGVDDEECLRRMQADKDLVFAERNYNYRLPEVRQVSQAFIDQVSQAFIDRQSPVKFFGQQALANLRLSEAHGFTRGNSVRVAVIDTGLDFNHPLFVGRVIGPFYDFVDNDGQPTDELNGAGSGHGTFVAGLIALTAPDAMIIPLRAFSPDGIGTSFNIAKAIRFAADHGARVINMSFGLIEKDSLIDEAMDHAHRKAYLVASAGNDNRDKIQFPAERADRAISVTATTANDIKAPFANFNSKMDVAAPGVSLYSAYPGGRWAWWSGTSFSTALVTGEATLLFALKPRLKNSDVGKAIKDSGVKIDSVNPSHKNKLGRRIDFRAAISRLWSSDDDDDDDDNDDDNDDDDDNDG